MVEDLAPKLKLGCRPKVVLDATRALTGVSSTNVTPRLAEGLGGGSTGSVLIVSSVCLGLGFGLNTRDMLTSRLNTGFFEGMLLARSRSFSSWARETERERERARASLDFVLAVVREEVDRVGEGIWDTDGARESARLGCGSGDDLLSVGDSVSEKGELGKTLEWRREQSSGTCVLNLWRLLDWIAGKHSNVHWFNYCLSKGLNPVAFFACVLCAFESAKELPHGEPIHECFQVVLSGHIRFVVLSRALSLSLLLLRRGWSRKRQFVKP